MDSDPDQVTIIDSDDGRELQTTEVRAKISSHKALVYLTESEKPDWEYEGMEVVIGDDSGNLLFSGVVISIDTDQKSLTGDGTNAVYKCLND